ncbi:MAG: hypothetical protein ACON36_04145 [Ilumatobacteraceae bacterium]
MRTPVSPITTSFSHFLKNLVIPRSAARSPLSVMRGRAHASITTSGSRQLAYLVENVTAYNTPPERITELVNMTTMMSVLGYLANTPTVHQELHLATVEPELWNEISHHVETFSTATTIVEKTHS